MGVMWVFKGWRPPRTGWVGASLPEWGLGGAEATETLRVHYSPGSQYRPLRNCRAAEQRSPILSSPRHHLGEELKREKTAKFKDLSKKMELPKSTSEIIGLGHDVRFLAAFVHDASGVVIRGILEGT